MKNIVDWSDYLEKRGMAEVLFSGIRYFDDRIPILILRENKGLRVLEIAIRPDNVFKICSHRPFEGVYLGVDPKNNTRFVFNEKRVKYTLITGAQTNEYQAHFLLLVHDLPLEIKQDASESLAASLGHGIPIFCLANILKNPLHIIKTMAEDQKEMLLRSFRPGIAV